MSSLTTLWIVAAFGLLGCKGVDPLGPSRVTTTCELHDHPQRFEGIQVSVPGTMWSDGMHYWGIWTEGCERKLVEIVFASDSPADSCASHSEILECPINAIGYRISGIYVGSFSTSPKPVLEIRDMRDLRRTRATSEEIDYIPWKSLEE